MMKRAFRDEWSAALRSGDYEQTRSELYGGGNEYCCLGVRCVLSDIDCQDEADSHGEEMPTEATLSSWGMSMTEAKFLANMNDSGKSFLQIASILDEMPVVD